MIHWINRLGLVLSAVAGMLAFGQAGYCADLVDCGFDNEDAADGNFYHPYNVALPHWNELDTLGNMWDGHTAPVDTGSARSLDHKANIDTQGGFVEVDLTGTSQCVRDVTFYWRVQAPTDIMMFYFRVNDTVVWNRTGTGFPTTYTPATVSVNQANVSLLRWEMYVLASGAMYIDDIVVTEGLTASVTADDPGPTNDDPISFSVQFNEDTVNFNDGNDVIVTTDPGMSYSNVTITQSDARNYTVDVHGASGLGNLALEVDTASDVQNTAGDPLLDSDSDTTQIDTVGPSTVAEQMFCWDPSPTQGGTLSFKVKFDEIVDNFESPGDIVITKDPGVLSGVVQIFEITKYYRVDVSDVGGDGDLTLEVNLASDIVDVLGNPASHTDFVTVTIDNTPPNAVVTAVSPSPTNLDAIVFLVAFDEDVVNFDAMDDMVLSVDPNVNLTGLWINPLSAADYQVQMTGVSGDGDVTLGLVQGLLSNVQDVAGNSIATSNSATVEVDNTPPGTIFNLLWPSPTGANIVGFEVVFDESVASTVTADDVSSAGTVDADIALVASSDPNYTFTATVIDPQADGTLRIAVGSDVFDLAGNPHGGSTSDAYDIFNFHGFLDHPQDGQIYIGGSHLFEVVPDCGNPSINYQWKHDDGEGKAVNDVGPDSDSYDLTDATLTQEGGYFCEALYEGDRFWSNTATLQVEPPVTVTPPVGGIVVEGDPFTFSVEAAGGYGAYHYAWDKDGYPVGNDSPIHEIVVATLDDDGMYSCEVSDDYMSKLSGSAYLAVGAKIPVAGLVGLGGLAGICLLGGVAILRRRRR